MLKRYLLWKEENNGIKENTRKVTLQSPVATLRNTGSDIHKLCVLLTQHIYMFGVDLRTNSDYFIGFQARTQSC